MNTLEAIEAGSVLDENLQHTYAKNFTTLRKYFPEVAQQLDRVDYRGILYRDNDFRYGIVEIKSDSQIEWLTDYDSIPQRQEKFFQILDQFETIFLLGAGIGEYLLLLADLEDGIKIPEIWIVEPRPLWLKLIFSFIDLHDFLGKKGLHFVVGEDWASQLTAQLAYFEKNRCLVIQNPTREMSHYCGILLRLIEKSGLDNIYFWGNYFESPRNRIEELRAVPHSKENVTNLSKNLTSLKNYQHLYCDNETLAEVLNFDSVVSCNRDGAVGVVIEEENQKKFLPLNEHDPSVITILKRFEKEYAIDDTYLIVGSGDGKVVQSILNMTDITCRWEGFAHIVYLVELHPAVFKASLCSYDFSKHLSLSRFRIFVGRKALELLASYLHTDRQARRPNKYFISNYNTNTDLPDKIENCFGEIYRYELAQSHMLYEKVFRYYDGITCNQWKRRLKQEQIKVLCITTRQSSFVQYCARDLMNGFKENHCECEIVIENDGLSSLTIPYIIQQINTFKPDFIVVLNHLRDESRNIIPPNIPYVCWILDPSHNVFDNDSLEINSFEMVYAISNEWIASLKTRKKYTNVDIGFLPLGVNHHIYKPLFRKLKKYDVTYISHMNHPKELFKMKDDQNDYILSVTESNLVNENIHIKNVIYKVYSALSQRLIAMNIAELNILTSNDNRKTFLVDLFNEMGVNSQELFDYLLSFRSRLWMTIEAFIKYCVIKSLVRSGFRVGVWGVNWSEYPDVRFIANGPAKNGAMINEIQNDSSISLNSSILLSFHMKSLEIMASKTFMLTRRNPYEIESLSNHFIEGEEVVFFDTEDDLVEKVQYYLLHPEEMEDIANKAYYKVLDNYTYKSLSKRILDGCSRHFA